MDPYYRYCEKCVGKVVMHAFSEGSCTICEENLSTSHTPCDKVCRECSKVKDVCMSCGTSMIKPYGNITKEDIEKAVEHVFRKQPKKVGERVIKFMTYCKGRNGPMAFSSEIWNPCSHPECGACRGMADALKKEAANWADTILDEVDLKFPDPLSPEAALAMYNDKNKDQLTSIEYLTEEEIKKKYDGLL